MRILFLHSTFPGNFRAVARAYSADGHVVLFLSENAARSTVLPGVRRLRLAPPKPCDSTDVAEKTIVELIRRAARAGNALLTLRKQGFAPDVLFTSAGMGGSLYVRDIFPEAYVVALADWFHTRENQRWLGRTLHSSVDFAPARVRNLWVYNALDACDLTITTSQWQQKQFPPRLQQGMHVLHAGINTGYFTPASAPAAPGQHADTGEMVTFCGQPDDPARGFDVFSQCLPSLLTQRPHCRVTLAWPDNKGKKDTAAGEASTPPVPLPEQLASLPEALRARVDYKGGCPLHTYRSVLRQSTVHVYLAEPHVFSAGLLEAMACKALVLASATPSVIEVLRHGSNGFHCDAKDSASLARDVACLLEAAPHLDAVRHAARETVVKEFDATTQAKRLMDLVAEGRKHATSRGSCPSPVSG